jgi:hypothetical protein
MLKINESKSSQVTFALRFGNCPEIEIKNKIISFQDETKYLGIILNDHLIWKPHLKYKRKLANSKLHPFLLFSNQN